MFKLLPHTEGCVCVYTRAYTTTLRFPAWPSPTQSITSLTPHIPFHQKEAEAWWERGVFCSSRSNSFAKKACYTAQHCRVGGRGGASGWEGVHASTPA